MRLKQLLGVSFLTLIACAMALAANPQLTNVTVAGEGRTTTVLLHANGAFTHTEYRPVDNLLLVDLAGVSSGKLKDTMQAVQKPGVISYRVLGYKGVYGVEVTRVELTLTQSAVVNIAAVSEGLEVRVSDSGPGAAAISGDAKSAIKTGVINPTPPVAASAAMPEKQAAKTPVVSPNSPVVASASVPEKPAVKTPVVKPSPAPVASANLTEKPAVATASGRLAQVRHVSVAQYSGGMAVEVSATAPLTPSVMRIESPDRLVMDLPNSVPVGLHSRINVNSPEIKAVRVAQFQADPPVTRVVVDLASAQDYVVENSGNNIYLRLHSLAAKTQGSAEPVVNAVAQPMPAAVAHLAESKPVVETKPVVQSKSVAKSTAVRMTIADNKPVPEPKPAIESKPVVEAKAVVHPKPVVEPKPAVESKPVIEPKPVVSQPAPTPANDLVVVQPHYAEKPAASEVDPKQASDAAAHIMSATTSTAPQALAPRTSATLAQPEAINSAAQQQQQEMQRPTPPPNGTLRYTGEPISVN